MASATKCRAKGGPENCSDPNCPQKRAPAARMADFYNHPAAPTKRPNSPKAQAMNRALGVALGWKGQKPAWWNEYVAKAQMHPEFPIQPELLDVIDSPAGKLAVVWQEESHDEHDLPNTIDSGIGLHVLYYRSVESGEVLGYLKLTTVNDRSFDRSFGTDEFMPLRFKERFGGNSFGLWYDERAEQRSTRNLEGEELLALRRKVWYPAMRHLGHGYTTADGEHISYYALSARHIPESDEQIKRDLDTVIAPLLPEIERHRKSYHHPTPDFSRLKEAGPLAGLGYGSAMYVYAARKLGESGRMLRASKAQSPDAKALWERFEKLMPERIKRTKSKQRDGSVRQERMLDFRSRKRR